MRDSFGNGRLFATVGAHGGLVNISYWGEQHLSGSEFFHGALETGWTKLFRACVGIGDRRYYLTLNRTKLYPFGLASRSEVRGIGFEHELLLLPDALVQRFRAVRNPKRLPIFIEMFHQERIVATQKKNRAWSDFEFNPAMNALIASCADESPVIQRGGEAALAQMGIQAEIGEEPRAVTWIGLSCDAPLQARFSRRHFKIYLTSAPTQRRNLSFFLVFASSREKLEQRLAQLSRSVDRECDRLLGDYEDRLSSRPRIDVGNPVLNSAFSQYPEVIQKMKLPDRPGAVRATLAGYFVWGWDGMTPLMSSPLSNEPDQAAAILRFFQEKCHPKIGLPHQFTTGFRLQLKGPFAAQTQYIAGVYHYLATTGDLSLVREVMPTCRFLLELCRRNRVGETGLVSGSSLWPDFPEDMDENGQDISAINNSLLYQALRSMESLAGILGDSALAEECRTWAAALRVHFLRYLFDEEKGYFISSCSSVDFTPRRHYCAQAVYWITPFARELVSQAPGRIAAFMQRELRSAKCLRTLPKWDTAWMADGNQLGSSFPTADYLYVNVHKLTGDDRALKAWIGDVEWFWRYHTAPEAFTPEVENEDVIGPDNHGCKQLQACTAWYALLYNGLAGLDFDHEGVTVTPWGDRPIAIRGLRLHSVSIDLRIRGKGKHVGTMTLNGKRLSSGSRKIAWNDFKGKKVRLDLVRSLKAPDHPVIVRADGLRVIRVEVKGRRLLAVINGGMTGEMVVQAPAKAAVRIDGQLIRCLHDTATGTLSIPFPNRGKMQVEITPSREMPKRRIASNSA